MTAFSIFKNYPFFGVGVKNFRSESQKELYNNEKLKFNDVRHSTHPHQLHFEILSENGAFGYIFFIIFIIWSLKLSISNYLKKKNLIQLASIIYILTSVLPFLPSGSFLSTFNSGIFWINYAIMLGINNRSKI